MRISLLSYKMPELKGAEYGVFAKIPRHHPDYNKRHFETTYKNDYERNFKNWNPTETNLLKNNSISAGVESGYEQLNKKRISTKLISERYNTEKDPKYNSIVQRTWTNYKEPAIKAVQDLKIDNTQTFILPPIDNELSLTLKSDKMFETIRSKSIYGCPKRKSEITKSSLKIPELRRY